MTRNKLVLVAYDGWLSLYSTGFKVIESNKMDGCLELSDYSDDEWIPGCIILWSYPNRLICVVD